MSRLRWRAYAEWSRRPLPESCRFLCTSCIILDLTFPLASESFRSAASGCRLKGELGFLNSDAACELASLYDPMTRLKDQAAVTLFDAVPTGLVSNRAVQMINAIKFGAPK